MADEDRLLRNLERMLDQGDPEVLVRYLTSLVRRGRTLEAAVIFVAKRFARRAPRVDVSKIVGINGGRHSTYNLETLTETPRQWIGLPFLDVRVTIEVEQRSEGAYEVSIENDELTGDGIVRIRKPNRP